MDDGLISGWGIDWWLTLQKREKSLPSYLQPGPGRTVSEATGANFNNTHTKRDIRASFLSSRRNRTFTYLYDNRRVQSSTWQQERGAAAQCRAAPEDTLIPDVICSEENNGERKKRGRRKSQIHVFMRDTIWRWMDGQWSCQQRGADNRLLLGGRYRRRKEGDEMEDCVILEQLSLHSQLASVSGVWL